MRKQNQVRIYKEQINRRKREIVLIVKLLNEIEGEQ